MEKLVHFSEACQVVMAAAAGRDLPVECVGLSAAQNRVLAAPQVSQEDLPQADNSAMDGYCVRHADIAGARADVPVTLPVSGRILAGHPQVELPSGTAMYIATGGLIPPGADTVIKIEDITESADEKTISLISPPPLGAYIRRRGKDLQAGHQVLNPGTLINPAVIGILAGIGRMVVPVFRKPRVAVLTSGDEVMMPFEPVQPWQVRNANTSVLSAQVREAGGEPLDFGIVRDETGLAVARIREALSSADVVVTCGGVSLGKKDPFIDAFRELAIEKRVHGVSLKPGKPFFFGMLDGKPVFGLPGNQASCSVTFELFVRPFLTRLLQQTDPDRPTLFLPLASPIRNPSGRDHFFRARLETRDGKNVVQPLATQDSHLLTSMLGARLLVRQPAAEKEWPAGKEVACLLIE